MMANFSSCGHNAAKCVTLRKVLLLLGKFRKNLLRVKKNKKRKVRYLLLHFKQGSTHLCEYTQFHTIVHQHCGC